MVSHICRNLHRIRYFKRLSALFFTELEFNSNPYEYFASFSDILINILRIFNDICITIFRFGNWILFFVFLAMGINLLTTAKEKEKQEKIHGKNLEYIQKRGRVGSIVLILISIGFLFKGFSIFLLICLHSPNPPPIYHWLDCTHLYNKVNSLEDVDNLGVYETSLSLFFRLLSFLSVILIAFGVYLIMFNKRVLRTRYKPYSFFILGVIMGIVCGFTSGLYLTI